MRLINRNSKVVKAKNLYGGVKDCKTYARVERKMEGALATELPLTICDNVLIKNKIVIVKF